MALKTLGTNATTSFNAFVVGTNDLIPADVATLLTGNPVVNGSTGIKTDIPMVNQALLTGIPRNLVNGAYTQQGSLIIPGRGVLICKVGDFVCVDPVTGWPILISADCAANGAVTHT